MAKFYTPTRISDNMYQTPEGFLVCVGVPIGRTGEMLYAKGEVPIEADSEGKVSISRDAKELFHPVAMASFEGKAFTIRHPEDFVTPENWKELAKGIVQNVRRGTEKDDDGEESLVADILVTDKMAIQMIQQGIREVSCGYEAVYEQLEPGRGIQKQIRGNHLALVDEGRAGPQYAINDHKTISETKKGSHMSKWSEKVKQILGKAVDEAAAMEEKEKNKDEASEPKKDMPAQDEDMGMGYDELVKIVKDMSEKMDALHAKTVSGDEEPKKEEKPAKDEDVNASLEERLKALELAVSKIMEAESAEANIMTDEDVDVEEMGDENPEMVGDTAARAEILAPGIRLTKDVKAKALQSAYSTKEGKSVIDSLTGGKAPAFDSKEQVNHLFIATSEILKASRGNGLKSSVGYAKDHQASQSLSTTMTAEKLNEMNQAFWSRKAK